MPAYSVPEQARELFINGILKNPLIQDQLPPEVISSSQNISFRGSDEPSIPINWRFAESISALKAYEAAILNVLLQRRYKMEPVKIEINTSVPQSRPPTLSCTYRLPATTPSFLSCRRSSGSLTRRERTSAPRL